MTASLLFPLIGAIAPPPNGKAPGVEPGLFSFLKGNIVQQGDVLWRC
jgi:hypothetical protein